MQKMMIIIIVIVYLLIGTFTSGFLQEEWKGPSMILILLWPLVLFLYMIFSFIYVIYELGKKLKKKLFK